MRYKTRELSDKEHKNIIRWLESHDYEPEPVKKLKEMSIDEQIRILEKYLTILKQQKRKHHEQIHPQTGQPVGYNGSLDE